MADSDALRAAYNQLLISVADHTKNLTAAPNPSVYPPLKLDSFGAVIAASQSFNAALDSSEIAIIQARDTLRRDLAIQHRLSKTT